MKLHGVPNQLNTRTPPANAPVRDKNIPISGFPITSPRIMIMTATLGHGGSGGNQNQMEVK